MDALKIAAVAGALAAAPAHSDAVGRWRPLIAEASARFGVPSDWIEHVIHAESAGRTSLAGRPIVSAKGAMGLMQLMPATWAAMGARLNLGPDPQNPRDNILAGTLYLRLLYDRFGYPGLFGAYSAGPSRYAEFVTRGRPLPPETRAYLSSVGSAAAPAAPTVAARREPPSLFAIGTVDRAISPSGSLFVALSREAGEGKAFP